jgi:hypothetical protein
MIFFVVRIKASGFDRCPGSVFSRIHSGASPRCLSVSRPSGMCAVERCHLFCGSWGSISSSAYTAFSHVGSYFLRSLFGQAPLGVLPSCGAAQL